MNDKAYEPEQMAFAERISKAMAAVPEDKRPMMETVVESVLIGACIAADPAQMQRPSA